MSSGTLNPTIPYFGLVLWTYGFDLEDPGLGLGHDLSLSLSLKILTPPLPLGTAPDEVCGM